MSTIESRHPTYSLKDVKKLIKSGCIKINSNASNDAYNDFGWHEEDIKKSLLKLNQTHFHKTEPYRGHPGTMIDYYKAKSLMYQNDVYIHFYIDPLSGVLIINSFKRL